MISDYRGPDFLGIGAPRCGTTWLHTQLSRHPNVWMPPYKELHFFDRSPKYASPSHFSIESPWQRLLLCSEAKNHVRSLPAFRRTIGALMRRKFHDAIWWSRVGLDYYNIDFYKRLFPRSGYTVCGEITPSYSVLNEEDIEIIHLLNPNMKFLYLIRNPIDRIWSSIKYRRDKGTIQIDLKDADQLIEAIEYSKTVESGIRRGEYIKTLDSYSRFFDPFQILVIFYDGIQDDVYSLHSAVARFIGVDISGFGKTVGRVNESKSHSSMPRRVYDYLRKTEGPLIDQLADKFGSYALQWRDGVMPPRSEVRVACLYGEVCPR